MSTVKTGITPLLRQPDAGWCRVLHKLWLTLFIASLLCPILSLGFEWNDSRERRAADQRMRSLPAAVTFMPIADLERLANAATKSAAGEFDPDAQYETVTIGEYYREGNTRALEEMAKLPGSAEWTYDWRRVYWRDLRFRWEYSLGFAGIPAFLLILRLWLGWLSR